MAFGGFVTALGLADDLQKGLIDRFRSLPMSRAAVLTGRTLADVGTNIVQTGRDARGRLRSRLPLRRTSAARIVGRHRCCCSSSATPSPGSSPSSASPPRRPRRRTPTASPSSSRVTFVSSAFVPSQSMPTLAAADRRTQPIHEHGQRSTSPIRRHPAGNQIWLATVWSIAIIAVFSALAVWRYRHAVGR